MSLPARLLNVVVVPGEVFDEVKVNPPRTANWLVPAFIMALVGVIAVIVIYSQPAIRQQIKEQQTKAFDQQVKAGKMTQEQADQFQQRIDQMGPNLMMLITSAGLVLVTFLRVVWWGFILWLLSTWFLKVNLGFTRTLEIGGLAFMIGTLGMIVGLLLSISFGKMGVTPSLGLLVRDFDLTSRTHMALGAVNLFNFWHVAVAALGLGKLAGVSFGRAAAFVFPYWLVQEAVLIAIGWGQMAQ